MKSVQQRIRRVPIRRCYVPGSRCGACGVRVRVCACGSVHGAIDLCLGPSNGPPRPLDLAGQQVP
jgi:hypothetical protein